MTTTHDWHRNREMWIRVLEKQTGEGLEAWNAKMRKHQFRDEKHLRAWLSRRNVTGYARQLLAMERFGYMRRTFDRTSNRFVGGSSMSMSWAMTIHRATGAL